LGFGVDFFVVAAVAKGDDQVHISMMEAIEQQKQREAADGTSHPGRSATHTDRAGVNGEPEERRSRQGTGGNANAGMDRAEWEGGVNGNGGWVGAGVSGESGVPGAGVGSSREWNRQVRGTNQLGGGGWPGGHGQLVFPTQGPVLGMQVNQELHAGYPVEVSGGVLQSYESGQGSVLFAPSSRSNLQDANGAAGWNPHYWSSRMA